MGLDTIGNRFSDLCLIAHANSKSKCLICRSYIFAEFLTNFCLFIVELASKLDSETVLTRMVIKSFVDHLSKQV